jgi:lipoate-protein ligase A
MARKPKTPDEPLREWRILIIRDRTHYLGRVVAPDKEAAIDKAMEEFGIEPARRLRVIAEPVA